MMIDDKIMAATQSGFGEEEQKFSKYDELA